MKRSWHCAKTAHTKRFTMSGSARTRRRKSVSNRRISPREEDVRKPGLWVVVVAGILSAGFPTSRANAMSITLAQAASIVDAALKKARELKQLPQTAVVLESVGHLVAAKREGGSGIIRFKVAVGKAYGPLGVGLGSRIIIEHAAGN